MNTPSELFYTTTDEWVRVENDGTLTIGITDYAQSELGEIVYVELPGPGETIAVGSHFGVVESVKAVGELNSPVSGDIIASNEDAVKEPGLVNESPYDNGWLIKVKTERTTDLSGLMDAAAYVALHG